MQQTSSGDLSAVYEFNWGPVIFIILEVNLDSENSQVIRRSLDSAHKVDALIMASCQSVRILSSITVIDAHTESS